MRDVDTMGPGHVQVWCLDAARVTDPSLHQRYLDWLSADERDRWRRFVFARDKLEFLVARALLRERLSFYTPAISPAQWQFVCNDYGRPSLTPLYRAQCSHAFNVSHSRGQIVVAFSVSGELGIDVEQRRALDDLPEMARLHFAPLETQALLALPPDQQVRRFFAYWTLKEAYIKARGMGLAIALDSFAFDWNERGQVTFDTMRPNVDVAHDWRFWQQPLFESCQMAVAWRDAATTATLQVQVRDVLATDGSVLT